MMGKWLYFQKPQVQLCAQYKQIITVSSNRKYQKNEGDLC